MDPVFTEPETLALIERIKSSPTEKMAFEEGLQDAWSWADEEAKPWYKKRVTWKWIIGLTAAAGIGIGGYYAYTHAGRMFGKRRKQGVR